MAAHGGGDAADKRLGPQPVVVVAFPKSCLDALAQRISAGLRHKHRVEGALGFSFGTTQFAKSKARHSSVLAETLRVFYELKPEQIDQMATIWSALHPSHQDGVLGQVNQGSTIRQNMQQKYGNGADGRIRSLVEDFQEEAKRLEDRLKRLLPADLDLVGTSDALQRNTSWTDAVRRQYKLFHSYYLWTSPEESFAGF